MAATRAEKPQNSAESSRLAVRLGRGSLLPAVRRADAATPVLANGHLSPGHIKDTSERSSLHRRARAGDELQARRNKLNPIPATKETIHG